jgi:uncharacterized protein YukE
MVAIEQEAARQKEIELREHEAEQIYKHFDRLKRDTNKIAVKVQKADKRKAQ